MTAEEVYESVTNGGTSDFAVAVAIFDRFGPWCLIGGLAVNCYAAVAGGAGPGMVSAAPPVRAGVNAPGYSEPIYSDDAHFVARKMGQVQAALADAGFTLQTFPHSANARRTGSKLSLQLTTDARYQDFLKRAERREVLGLEVPVATLGDVVQGKIWAWQDQERRLTKRKKDELDLLRLAEAHPHLVSTLPPEIVRQLEGNT